MSSDNDESIGVPIGGKKDLIVGFLLVEWWYNDDGPNAHEGFLCVKDLLYYGANRVFSCSVGKDFVR